MPDAATIDTAQLISAGGLVAEVLSDLVLEQLYDPTDLTALMTFVPWNAGGSDTLRSTLDAVPGAYTARTSEIDGTNIANAAYATGKFDLIPAGYSRKYELTDLLPIAGGPIQVERVAANLVAGVGLTMTDLLCALFPALLNDVGPGSGVDLDVSSIYDAQFQLNSQSVTGPYACVLHPQQINDFQNSLRAEAGAIQFQAATAEMLAARGPGFRGSWNGIQFFQSDSVSKVNTNADYAGAMFGAGCFGYTLADARLAAGHIPPGLLYLQNEALVIEMARDQTNFTTALIASIFPAVVEIEDLRGVEIISDV
jgi:hypothetical protein